MTRVASPSGANRTSTRLARAGSGCGTRWGLICQVNAIRAGGSHVTTRPQSQRNPCGPVSKQWPPSRGSIPISCSTLCDHVYSAGHQAVMPSVNAANAASGAAATLIWWVMDANLVA